MMISIKALVEDTGSEQLALGIEHGLSLYVETPQSVFVFDHGATGLAWQNAPRMHAELSRVQFAVCSHAHYDHAGGFPSLLQHVKPQALYTGAGFWDEKYGWNQAEQKYTYLGAGFGQKELADWGVEQRVCGDVLQLDDSCWLMGNFARRYAFETIPARFVCGEDKHADTFGDEICLVVREGDGVAVITGCSHPGILNMVTAVHERLQLPVLSVMGGTHLMEADAARIDRTLAKLREMGTRRLGLCHCSGTLVRERLQQDALAGCLLSTGDMVEFA